MSDATWLDVVNGRSEWCIEQRDALALLADLPTGGVDAVVTDPPYSSGGMVRSDRTQSTATKYVSSGVENPGTNFSGDNRDQRAYSYWSALWMSEALRCTKAGGVLLAFCDWRQLPTTTDAIQAGGWVWRGIVPWAKSFGARGSRPVSGRFAAQCEYVVWGSNGPMEIRMGEDPCLHGFYQCDAPRDRVHQTQKPIEVMRELVKICPPGGIVLDPFAGSATTGVAALLEGRRAIMSEMQPEIRDIARVRMSAIARGGDAKNPNQGALFA